VLHVNVAQSSSDDNATLCTYGFVDDVTFSYNGENRPESKTTCMFCQVCQAAAPVGRQATLFASSAQGGGTGGGGSLLPRTASCSARERLEINGKLKALSPMTVK